MAARAVLSRVGLVAGWVTATAMLAGAALRLVGADRSTFEIAVVSALPWILIPSLPITILAVWRRRWMLAVGAAASLVGGAVWEGPVMWPLATAPAAARGGHLVVFDANVAQDNFDLSGIAREITADHPDVVTLEELTPKGLASLLRTGVMDRFAWHLLAAQAGAGGMGVWSDVPATGLSTWSTGSAQVEMEGWLHPPGGPAVRLEAIHVYAPVGYAQPAGWRDQLGQVARHLASQPRPLLVTGDFNATADDRPFQHILGLGLRDAAVLAGKGWEMTWPRNQAWVIPYLRIDHILLSAGLTVTGYRLGIGRGSDHHPLVVGIAPRA